MSLARVSLLAADFYADGGEGLTTPMTVIFAPVVGNCNRSKGTNDTPNKAWSTTYPIFYTMCVILQENSW